MIDVMDKNYNDAVIELRRLVEQQGVHVEEALSRVTSELGLNQVAQINREARAHYAPKPNP